MKRRKWYSEDKSRTLTVRISEADYEWLQHTAEKRNEGRYVLREYRVSDLVRELIRDARKNPEM